MELIPLCTAKIFVAAPLVVGDGPHGARSIAPIVAATVTGERLSGELAGPAADWVVRNGTVNVVDVRLTIRTPDDALIHITYGGRLDASDPANVTAYVAPTFEAGDERYAWLNNVQAVGKGVVRFEDGKPFVDYTFYQLG